MPLTTGPFQGGGFYADCSVADRVERTEREAIEALVLHLEREIERLRAKVQRLEARGIEDMRHSIEAVLALHVAIKGRGKEKVCQECSGFDPARWPCPTAKALTDGRE